MSDPTPAALPYVAVIGAGYWGKNLVRNFHGLGVLHSICDADAAHLASFEDAYPDVAICASSASILGNPEIRAVAIATAAESHAELVRAALNADKDVFVEKPLCLDANEGRALVDLAAERGRILMVGHLLWYHPAVLKLKGLIQSGELGRLQYIYSNRLNIGKIRREENILWSFAPHDVSVILGLLEEEPSEVSSHGGNYLQPNIADVTLSVLNFPSGVRAHVFVSWLHPVKEQKLVVVGSKKMAVFDDIEPEHKLRLYAHSIDWQDRIPVANKQDAESVPLEMGEPLRTECEHFLHCVETRETPRTDGEEGLRVLRLLERCQTAMDAESRGASSDAIFVHASASVDAGAQIGDGTAIWHVSHILGGSVIGRDCKIGQNVVIGPDARVGNRVKIQNNVSVYKGVVLEDDVFCGPSMVFTNVINPRAEISRMEELLETHVKKGATLGANCTIVCGHTIGEYAFVGAGAVVTGDVPAHALVYGNPARQQGWMCRCGERLADGSEPQCAECGTRYLSDGGGLRAV